MNKILLFLFPLLLLSCSTSKEKLQYKTFNESYNKNNMELTNLKSIDEIPEFESTKNLVAPGFLFSLYHPSDDKLKGKFRADYEGMLRLPYNVDINVKGLTLNELRKVVLNSYKKFFQKGVRDVTFKLEQRRYYVEMRGFVKNSGRYLVRRKESIDKLIDKAGGLKGGSLSEDLFTASIKQQDKSYSISLNQYFEKNFFGKAITWTGGDSVFINLLSESSIGQSLPIVTVLGGVQNPGKTLYQQDESLFYYLSKMGGTLPNLGFEESYIIRETPEGLIQIQFDLTDMKTIPAIYPNDTIMLNAQRRNDTDKFLERAVQIASILTSLLLIHLAF